MHALTVPVLVTEDEKDALVLASHTAHLLSCIAHAPASVYAGVGHGAPTDGAVSWARSLVVRRNGIAPFASLTQMSSLSASITNWPRLRGSTRVEAYGERVRRPRDRPRRSNHRLPVTAYSVRSSLAPASST